MKLVENALQHQGDFLNHGIWSIDGIKIEDRKIGPLDKLHPGTPGVLRDRSHVGDVEQLVSVCANEIADVPLHVGRPDLLSADPIGSVVVRILLIEMLPVDSIRIAVKHERAVQKMRNQKWGNPVVVSNEIAFGEAAF